MLNVNHLYIDLKKAKPLSVFIRSKLFSVPVSLTEFVERVAAVIPIDKSRRQTNCYLLLLTELTYHKVGYLHRDLHTQLLHDDGLTKCLYFTSKAPTSNACLRNVCLVTRHLSCCSLCSTRILYFMY